MGQVSDIYRRDSTIQSVCFSRSASVERGKPGNDKADREESAF